MTQAARGETIEFTIDAVRRAPRIMAEMAGVAVPFLREWRRDTVTWEAEWFQWIDYLNARGNDNEME